MNEPVFQDAGHALHVSYLIHSMPQDGQPHGYRD